MDTCAECRVSRLQTWLRVLHGIALPAACLLFGLPAVSHPEIELSIQEVTRRIAADPSNASLYLQRGDFYRIHQEWSAAVADFDRARQLDPSLRLLDFSVGKMRFETGQPEAALAHLNRFLAKEHDDAEGLTLRGHILVRLDDPLAAAADYGRAIDLRVGEGAKPPPDLFIWRARALMAAGGKHCTQALRGLEEGLDLLARPITLELEALDVELVLKRFDDALSRADRLASASARPEPWLVRRGGILERSGRLAESRQSYLAALEAITALPASRRNTDTLVKLEREARTALARIPGNHTESMGE